MFKIPDKPFKIVVGNDEYHLAPEDFNIIGTDDPDLRTGAGKYFFFLAIEARCAKAHRTARRKEERWIADKITSLLKADPKLTEWKAKSQTLTLPERKALARAVSETSYNEALASACVRSMMMKVDLIRTGRADRRDEKRVARDVDYVGPSKERSDDNKRKVREALAGKGKNDER